MSANDAQLNCPSEQAPKATLPAKRAHEEADDKPSAKKRDRHAGRTRKDVESDGAYTQDKGALATKHAHPFDKNIFFGEEWHEYLVDVGGKGEMLRFQSVSAACGEHFPPFDSAEVIAGMRASPNWPQSKYFGMTTKQIEQTWKDNARRGTEMHAVIEQLANGEPVPGEKIARVEVQQFLAFEKEWLRVRGIEPYRVEWRIYSERYRLAGTLDWLGVLQDQSAAPPDTLDVVLLDHKCIEKLEMRSFNMGTGPCEDLPANNFIKYSLACNMYREMLKNYKNVVWRGRTYMHIHVVNMYLDIFHPTHETWQIEPVAELQTVVDAILALRAT